MRREKNQHGDVDTDHLCPVEAFSSVVRRKLPNIRWIVNETHEMFDRSSGRTCEVHLIHKEPFVAKIY